MRIFALWTVLAQRYQELRVGAKPWETSHDWEADHVGGSDECSAIPGQLVVKEWDPRNHQDEGGGNRPGRKPVDWKPERRGTKPGDLKGGPGKPLTQTVTKTSVRGPKPY